MLEMIIDGFDEAIGELLHFCFQIVLSIFT
jgi:hypothetical protein